MFTIDTINSGVINVEARQTADTLMAAVNTVAGFIVNNGATPLDEYLITVNSQSDAPSETVIHYRYEPAQEDVEAGWYYWTNDTIGWSKANI
jgi:hypothetical protein